MSTDKPVASGAMLSELFQFGFYKPTQGKMVRQVTGAALAATFALAAWRLFETLTGQQLLFANDRYVWPSVLLLAGLWFSFRIVNYPRFADFLIAVEAEMSKVSWPSRSELVRSSMVVILVIVLLTMTLFVLDSIWLILLQLTKVIPSGGDGS